MGDLSFLVEFFKSAMLQTIIGLIALDLLFGIWSAIKAGKFDWKKVGTFYRTNVIPYVGGYLTVFVAFSLVPGLEEMLAGELTVASLFSAIVFNLGGSIIANLGKLGLRK